MGRRRDPGRARRRDRGGRPPRRLRIQRPRLCPRGPRTAAHRGDLARAREGLAHAARLRPQLTYALPFFSVQALLELARTYLALADAAGARVVLREVRDVLRLRPDLGTLPREADELRSTLDNLQVGAVETSSLTTAELRLVPLLSTHLSFREIGERLYISRHTVKTQAISVYRKLGVAVAAARRSTGCRRSVCSGGSTMCKTRRRGSASNGRQTRT